MDPNQIALEVAHELEFDLVGCAPLAPPQRAAEFESWIREGLHGSMGYLETQESRIVNPGEVLPGAHGLLILGLGHSRPALELPGGARVARYAGGRDYHNLIGKRLRKLQRRLREAGLREPFRGIVDAGPLMERSHAAQAGLGFESKAANLLAPRFGPWFFLGELLLGEELEARERPDGPNLPNCGTCTACIDACPTEAIVAPGRVDARRCISYLTIEHRGSIDHDLRASMGPWVFGCDICSEVCPWGTDAPDRSALFGTHPSMEATEPISLITWLTEREGFSERMNGSPLQRPKREGLARNAAIVLGNLPSDEGKQALILALEEDPSPLVRAAAGWGLLHAFGEESRVRQRVDHAAHKERDESTSRDLRRSLELEAPKS